jgi:hypothetical protein
LMLPPTFKSCGGSSGSTDTSYLTTPITLGVSLNIQPYTYRCLLHASYLNAFLVSLEPQQGGLQQGSGYTTRGQSQGFILVTDQLMDISQTETTSLLHTAQSFPRLIHPQNPCMELNLLTCQDTCHWSLDNQFASLVLTVPFVSLFLSWDWSCTYTWVDHFVH